jgi:hypothetical protein
VHRPAKQKPKLVRFDIENTSPQDQNIVRSSRLGSKDVSLQAQSTTEPYPTEQLKRDTWLRIRLSNKGN